MKEEIRSRQIRIDVATLYSVLGQPMAYQPAFAKLPGGVPTAVFISYIIHWVGKGDDPEGWIYKTGEQIEEDTGLSPYQQRNARTKLINLDILQEKRIGIPGIMHFNIDMQELFHKLSSFTCTSEVYRWTTSEVSSLVYKEQERTTGKNKQEREQAPISEPPKQLPPHLAAIENGVSHESIEEERQRKHRNLRNDEHIPAKLKTELVDALLSITRKTALVDAGDEQALNFAHTDATILYGMGYASAAELNGLAGSWATETWQGQAGNTPSGRDLKTYASELAEESKKAENSRPKQIRYIQHPITGELEAVEI